MVDFTCVRLVQIVCPANTVASSMGSKFWFFSRPLLAKTSARSLPPMLVRYGSVLTAGHFLARAARLDSPCPAARTDTRPADDPHPPFDPRPTCDPQPRKVSCRPQVTICGWKIFKIFGTYTILNMTRYFFAYYRGNSRRQLNIWRCRTKVD